MQVVQKSQEKFSSTKIYESITVTCNDNGITRKYEFNNLTASDALHSICALYSKQDIKTIILKTQHNAKENNP